MPLKFLNIILFFIVTVLPAFNQQIALIDTSTKHLYTNNYFINQCVEDLRNNDFISLGQNVNKWKKYHSVEPADRLYTLLQIKNNNFNVQDNKDLIKNICIYKAVKNGYINNDTVHFLPYRIVTGYKFPGDEFEQLTEILAQNLVEKTSDMEAKQVARFYANLNDSIFITIQRPEFEETELNEAYLNFVEDVIKDSFHVKFGVLTGYWIPSGDLGSVGNHPTAGFQMGGQGLNGWALTLTMLQRFGNTRDTLLLNFESGVLPTQKYLGGFYGIDISKSIYSSINNEFDVSAGLGLDDFLSTYDFPDEGTYTEKYINSLNFNVGLTYRYIFYQSYYVEFQLKYNFIDYENEGGTSLKGNAIGINLNVGFFSGGRTRRDIMRYLDYKF